MSRPSPNIPGCCSCPTQPYTCCIRFYVGSCSGPIFGLYGLPVEGVSITLKVGGTTVLSGVTDATGLVAVSGVVQEYCVNTLTTFNLSAWSYVNDSRITPSITSWTFGPHSYCAASPTVLRLYLKGA